MWHEANIESIQALKKQIDEGKGDIIELKRTRNSLLNISTRVPPEILARIFVCSLVWEAVNSPPSRDFGKLRKDSYNFLLVCHHWFEVASRTPELWSFWGNTLKDWKKHHRHSGAAPVDLVLYGPECDHDDPLDGPLRDAVRSRVVQNTIRRVHLTSYNYRTLTSIISSLTPDDKGGQNDNIESIVWRNEGFTLVDVSDFFARSRLSKLRLLDLTANLQISSWDCLKIRTTLLTVLCLEINVSPPSPTPTTSQLFSILTSNPNLRELRLFNTAIPNDTDGSAFGVPLRYLKALSLTGDFRHLFRLLHRLILPQVLDEMRLIVCSPTVEDISQILTPYMRDYFRRDARFQDRLEVSSSSSYGLIAVSAAVVCPQATAPAPRVSLTVALSYPLPPDLLERFFTNLIAPIPLEPVVSFIAAIDIKLPEELLLAMLNTETLSICGVELSKGFLQPSPDGPHAKTKLLPSLRSLSLGNISLSDGSWGHLTTYLAQQTSDKRIVSLRVFGYVPNIHPEVVNEIKDLVGEFIYPEIPGAGV